VAAGSAARADGINLNPTDLGHHALQPGEARYSGISESVRSCARSGRRRDVRRGSAPPLWAAWIRPISTPRATDRFARHSRYREYRDFPHDIQPCGCIILPIHHM